MELKNFKAEILSELTNIFNQRVEQYFNKDFYPALEEIVGAKWDELNQSENNASLLDQTIRKGENEHS